jgi:uncharacterized protein (DUF736 family)
MAEYDNNLTGVLFKNDKGDNEKRPDYKGSASINGEEFNVSAWIREKKDGSGKYMSMKYEAKEAPKAAKQEPKRHSHGDDLDSDLPF